jgi:hypothetical protein
MRALIGIVIGLMVHTVVAAQPSPALDPEETQSLSIATSRGQALYQTLQKSQAPDSPAVASARALIKDFCPELQYRAIAVEEDGVAVVYFIGSAASPDAVVFGRHFRVAGSTVEPSTKACLVVTTSKDGKNAVAAATTALLSDTPTAFHVVESYLHPRPLYVMTRTGVWVVQGGQVQLLQRRQKSTAPPDRPVDLESIEKLSQQEKELAPLIAKARETYPAALDRFKQGLLRGEHFAVVTRLRDASGRFEQIFVEVKSVQPGGIDGIIVSDVELVSDHRRGDRYHVPDGEILDWVISRPDGSEEGNLIGKYLDSRH